MELITQDLPEEKDPSLSDFLPKAMKEAYLKIPPEWLQLEEKVLKEVCYGKPGAGRPPSFDTDQKLRTAFWLEYDLSIHQARPIIMTQIYSRIVSTHHFNEIMKNPKRFAWITHPPGDFVVDTENLLSRSTQLYYELFDLPYKEKICRCHYYCVCKPPGIKPANMTKEDCACFTGCKCPEIINTKLIDSFIKMREALELRAKGSVPQVIKQQNTNLHLHAKATQKPTETKSLEQLQGELEALRSQKAKLLQGTEPTPLTQEVKVIEAEVIE